MLIKRLDLAGRLVIPRTMLEPANLEPGDIVELYAERDEDDQPAIVIRRRTDKCVFCGGLDELVRVRGKFVCSTCLLPEETQ